MTEFEINKKVASIYLPCDYNINDYTEQVELIRFLGDTNEYEVYGIFDPCNNLSQAWEIMLKYGITIVFQSGKYEFATYDGEIESNHQKPLVAAMLVFLEI